MHTARLLPRATREPHSTSDTDRERGLIVAAFAAAVVALSAAAAGATVAGLPYLVAVAIALAAAFHLARHFAVPDRSHAGCRGRRVRGHALYLALAAAGVVVALSPAAVAGARGSRPPVAPKVGGPGQVVRVSQPAPPDAPAARL